MKNEKCRHFCRKQPFLTIRHHFRAYLYTMFKILEELLLFYLLYKLIFDLIIPAAQTTRQVKRQFSDMQSKMQEQAERFNSQHNNRYQDQNTATKSTAYTKPDKDDYIDFEEIK